MASKSRRVGRVGLGVLWCGLVVSSANCKHRDPLYCDEQTPCLEGYEACDLTGACTELRNTCLAPEDVCWDAAPGNADGGIDGAPQICTPDAFIRCDPSGDVVACNAEGTAEVTLPCDTGCDEQEMGCNDCVPDSSVCAGDVLTVCSSTGAVESMDPCPLGCHAGGQRCNDLDPSNGLAGHLDDAASASDLVLGADATINTDTGAIFDGTSQLTFTSALVTAPADGVAVRVIPVRSFSCQGVTVSGTAALAIVSDGDVVITGRLSVAASLAASGPGAITSEADDCAGDSISPTSGGGSGGAGFGSVGQRGGNGNAQAGSAGGSVSGNLTITPLRGGCRGGRLLSTAPGGGGGGAIQIVSRSRITLGGVAPGFIDAGGGGGPNTGMFTEGAGAGGGSGGGILLEAPTVELGGGSGIVANGGAGGCEAAPGENGTTSTLPAQGGDCSGLVADGGDGASAVGAATQGADITGSSSKGGGGGAGYGRVRVNNASGAFTPSGAILSPAPSVGIVATR